MSKFEYIVIMPKMSMTMEEGALLEFRVKTGDTVKSGEVLFDVATDKIDMEVESPADGVVAEIIGVVGSTINVGAPVLKLFTEREVMSFNLDAPPRPLTLTPISLPTIVTREEVAVSAVPKARVLAAEEGIDLSAISPSGLQGMITHEDVLNFQRNQDSNPRRAANRKMVAKAYESTRRIPQLTLSRLIEFSSLNQEGDLATLASAWAKILRKNTHVNIATLTERPNSNVSVALVMESKYGLALPVFSNPDRMTHEELAALIVQTQVQARDGKVPINMLNGATTSIFDLSRTSITSALPLLMPSHATALTLGGKSRFSEYVELSLTMDLRFCDSLEAADLLDQLVSTL